MAYSKDRDDLFIHIPGIVFYLPSQNKQTKNKICHWLIGIVIAQLNFYLWASEPDFDYIYFWLSISYSSCSTFFQEMSP